MDKRLIKEAVDWFVRMHDGPPSAAMKTQFTEWLLTSPDHIRAFLEITQSFESLGDAARELDRDKLIAGAVADVSNSNVIPLEGISRDPSTSKSTAARFARKPWFLAGIAGLALSTGALCGWLACEHAHQDESLRSRNVF